MSTLSIHIDESGNIDFKNRSAQFFLITFVFHDHKDSIQAELDSLNRDLAPFNIKFVHASPLIRNKPPFDTLTPEERVYIFRRFFGFVCRIPITYKTFCFEKPRDGSATNLRRNIKTSFESFIDANITYFSSFDTIVINYDYGQEVVGKALAAFSERFSNVTIHSSGQAEHRLLQVSDLICTLEQINQWLGRKKVSKSVLNFFESVTTLRKYYLDRLKRKKFDLSKT